MHCNFFSDLQFLVRLNCLLYLLQKPFSHQIYDGNISTSVGDVTCSLGGPSLHLPRTIGRHSSWMFTSNIVSLLQGTMSLHTAQENVDKGQEHEEEEQGDED